MAEPALDTRLVPEAARPQELFTPPADLADSDLTDVPRFLGAGLGPGDPTLLFSFAGAGHPLSLQCGDELLNGDTRLLQDAARVPVLISPCIGTTQPDSPRRITR